MDTIIVRNKTASRRVCLWARPRLFPPSSQSWSAVVFFSSPLRRLATLLLFRFVRIARRPICTENELIKATTTVLQAEGGSVDSLTERTCSCGSVCLPLLLWRWIYGMWGSDVSPGCRGNSRTQRPGERWMRCLSIEGRRGKRGFVFSLFIFGCVCSGVKEWRRLQTSTTICPTARKRMEAVDHIKWFLLIHLMTEKRSFVDKTRSDSIVCRCGKRNVNGKL